MIANKMFTRWSFLLPISFFLILLFTAKSFDFTADVKPVSQTTDIQYPHTRRNSHLLRHTTPSLSPKQSRKILQLQSLIAIISLIAISVLIVRCIQSMRSKSNFVASRRLSSANCAGEDAITLDYEGRLESTDSMTSPISEGTGGTSEDSFQDSEIDQKSIVKQPSDSLNNVCAGDGEGDANAPHESVSSSSRDSEVDNDRAEVGHGSSLESLNTSASALGRDVFSTVINMEEEDGISKRDATKTDEYPMENIPTADVENNEGTKQTPGETVSLLAGQEDIPLPDVQPKGWIKSLTKGSMKSKKVIITAAAAIAIAILFVTAVALTISLRNALTTLDQTNGAIDQAIGALNNQLPNKLENATTTLNDTVTAIEKEMIGMTSKINTLSEDLAALQNETEFLRTWWTKITGFKTWVADKAKEIRAGGSRPYTTLSDAYLELYQKINREFTPDFAAKLNEHIPHKVKTGVLAPKDTIDREAASAKLWLIINEIDGVLKVFKILKALK